MPRARTVPDALRRKKPPMSTSAPKPESARVDRLESSPGGLVMTETAAARLVMEPRELETVTV